MMKYTIQEVDLRTINLYASNNMRKQKLLEIQGEFYLK